MSGVFDMFFKWRLSSEVGGLTSQEEEQSIKCVFVEICRDSPNGCGFT